MRLIRFATAAGMAALMGLAPPAAADEPADARPTNWHEAARTASLLQAPVPERPVAVCVVDTGVNLTPDLEGPVVYRGADDGGTPDDVAGGGHGTHVASFIAAQINGWGMAGTWPQAKVVSVRVFPEGGGMAGADAYSRALDQCRQHPDVKVVNLSLAGPRGSEAELRELESVARILRERRDINVVVAAGNGGGEVESPGRAGTLVTVAAADISGSFCAFSARGPEVDVVAPGCGLDGAALDGQPRGFSGTSFAAPQVSALIAALRSYASLDASQAEAAVFGSARPTPAGPMVDGEAALRSVGLSYSVSGQQDPAPGRASADGYVDHPEPQVRFRKVRGGWAIRIRLLNRPTGVSVEVRSGRVAREYASSRLIVHVPARSHRLRLRYLSDEGAGPWLRLRLRRVLNR